VAERSGDTALGRAERWGCSRVIARKAPSPLPLCRRTPWSWLAVSGFLPLSKLSEFFALCAVNHSPLFSGGWRGSRLKSREFISIYWIFSISAFPRLFPAFFGGESNRRNPARMQLFLFDKPSG
jgi:hypothetical protein